MPISKWFLVVVEASKPMHFLVQSDTPGGARKRVCNPDQKSRVSRVNWDTMRKLTGCIIPMGCRGQDFADGVLAFGRGEVVVTIV